MVTARARREDRHFRTIVGRYERGEMTPSIDVAKKIAEAFDVTVDQLVSDFQLTASLEDRHMLERWGALDDLGGEDRERMLQVVDGLIRDARTRLSCAAGR
jgi:transcriptional regulator with XRE-family HTH domain